MDGILTIIVFISLFYGIYNRIKQKKRAKEIRKNTANKNLQS